MWNFIKRFFTRIPSRYEEEEIQRELYDMLLDDKTLTSDQFRKLYDVIHCGAYCSLHDVEQYKSYIKEAEIYDEIIRTSNDPNVLYKRFKEVYLSDN